jgi:hypothetical protein
MDSLRTYGKSLAYLLEMKPAALYERQRLLLRTGLLKLEGRGPGGGAKAIAKNVALLIIAAMATDTVVGAEKRVREMANAKAIGRRRDTGLKVSTFAEGLAKVIASTDIVGSVEDVTVSRNSIHAMIRIERGLLGQTGDNTYVFSSNGRPWPSYRVQARIGQDLLFQIADYLEESST